MQHQLRCWLRSMNMRNTAAPMSPARTTGPARPFHVFLPVGIYLKTAWGCSEATEGAGDDGRGEGAMARQRWKQKREYTARLRELEKQKELLELKKQVRDREIELGIRKPRRKPCWSKAMMAVVYVICIEIIVYAEAVMWVRHDLSALYALIGVPAAMLGVFWAYAEKSKCENTKGGITYDIALREAPEKEPAGGELEPSEADIPIQGDAGGPQSTGVEDEVAADDEVGD